MVLGLKPMGKPSTKEKSKVLYRTKALHGPQTQAYRETNYLKAKLQSSDSSLWETNYLQWKSYVTGTLESARGELPINNWLSP